MPRKLHITELGRMDQESFRKSDKQPLVLVLDQLRSAYNTGSIFRTADAFRLEKLFLCGFTPAPPHKEISKTALGADQSVKWEHCEHTTAAIRQLKEQGYYIVAAEHTSASIPLQSFAWPEQPTALVVGDEVFGIQQEVIELCDACVEIPQFGTKHSLNVAVSAGIILWEYTRRRLPEIAV
jgi:tRNA G18 (ribose-2'-O)-methylase SpoU